MRAKLRKVWLPYGITILLASAWFIYSFSQNLLNLEFWGRSFVFIRPVWVMVSVFSAQNILATPFVSPKHARIVNMAALAAWGLYIGFESITMTEGQGYAIFGLKVLVITAIPILWVHREKAI